MVPNGCTLWLTSEDVSVEWRDEEREKVVDEAALLRVAKGRNLGFTRMVARRNPSI
jgi:hypothetical protein